MKEFNKVNSFKNLKFHSVIQQDILQAVSLLEKLGYEAGFDFSADDAAEHNGVCAWDDGEITEGWLCDDDFDRVTLEELKGMVGEGIKDNVFTLERLLGCEYRIFDMHFYFNDEILKETVRICNELNKGLKEVLSCLTFFTEDGDELTFDEYLNMYYGE